MIKSFAATLVVVFIGSYMNLVSAMDEKTPSVSSVPKYFGATKFRESFEGGKHKALGDHFYQRIRDDNNAFQEFKEYYILEDNVPTKLSLFGGESLRSHLLDCIYQGQLIPAAIVSIGEIGPPCVGYYYIPGTIRDDCPGDVYYVKASEVEKALQK